MFSNGVVVAVCALQDPSPCGCTQYPRWWVLTPSGLLLTSYPEIWLHRTGVLQLLLTDWFGGVAAGLYLQVVLTAVPFRLRPQFWMSLYTVLFYFLGSLILKASLPIIPCTWIPMSGSASREPDLRQYRYDMIILSRCKLNTMKIGHLLTRDPV